MGTGSWAVQKYAMCYDVLNCPWCLWASADKHPPCVARYIEFVQKYVKVDSFGSIFKANCPETLNLCRFDDHWRFHLTVCSRLATVSKEWKERELRCLKWGKTTTAWKVLYLWRRIAVVSKDFWVLFVKYNFLNFWILPLSHYHASRGDCQRPCFDQLNAHI